MYLILGSFLFLFFLFIFFSLVKKPAAIFITTRFSQCKKYFKKYKIKKQFQTLRMKTVEDGMQSVAAISKCTEGDGGSV